MKKAKILTTIILLFFCFTLNSELYQSYLTSFGAEYSYIQVTTDEYNNKSLSEYISSLSDSLKKPFFYVEESNEKLGETNVDVYCTDLAYKQLVNEKNIKEGTFGGAISGETSVRFYDINSLSSEINTYKMYFDAENYEYETIYKKIKNHFVCGYVHRDDYNGQKFFSIVLWVIFGIVYVLFSILDLQFRKKEIFIKMSFGMSKLKAISIEIIKDSVWLLLITNIMRLILSQYFYVDFNLTIIIKIIVLCIIFNLFIYLSIYRIDYKEILYGGNIGEKTVTNCYIVKVFSMVLTVLLISMNIALVSMNIEPLINSKYIQKYNKYEFAELIKIERKQIEIVDDAVQQNKLAIEGYKTGNAIISVNNPLFNDEFGVVFTNDISLLIDAGKKDFSNNGEHTIIVPYNIHEAPESEKVFFDFAYSFVNWHMGITLGEEDFNIVYADKPSKALYFDLQDNVNAQLGYAISENPFFIYVNTELLDFEKYNEKELCETQASVVLYKENFLERDFDFLDENEIDVEKTIANEIFVRNKVELTKIVTLSFIIIFLQILVDVSLISALVKVEYSANSLELSIKNLLGYSIFSKNKSLIFLNIYSGLVGIMTAVILFFMLKIDLIFIAMIAGSIVIITEMMILILVIIRFEKMNIIKIIKGGAL